MKVAVFAAHPDDEVLGVGGAIIHHKEAGDDVYVVIVTEGSSTQYEDDEGKILQKVKEAEKVQQTLGIKKVIHLGLPDMKLDTLAKVDVNKKISEVVNEIKPEVVYTHFYGDVNSDHHTVFEATLVACRPVQDCSVRKLLCYQTPSSTEWGAQASNLIYSECLS